MTDGVAYVCENGGAWIVDAIASHQTSNINSDPMLREFQIWELQVNTDSSAVLICLRDTSDVVLTQAIEYTDFAIESIKFYLSLGVLMLPSEY